MNPLLFPLPGRSLLAGVFLLLQAGVLPGQVYTFSQHHAPYQSLQSPGLENIIKGMSSWYVNVALGFGFRYHTRTFWFIRIQEDGSVFFHNNEVNPPGYLVNVLFGEMGDVADCMRVQNCEPGAPSAVVHETTGPPGNRVFTLEYKRIGLLDRHINSQPRPVLVGYANLQLRLYERSGDLEVHFGSSFVHPHFPFLTSVAAYYSPYPAPKGIAVYDTVSAPKVTPPALPYDTVPPLLGIPPSGTIYRFGFDRDLTWNNLPGVGWDITNGTAAGSGKPNNGFVHSDIGGALLGHNRYKDREFAEKYYLSERAVVKGMASQHYGSAASSDSASFSLYAVAPNGLPGQQLVQQKVPYRCLDREGKLNYVPFQAFTEVKDSFFVAFGLAPYDRVAEDTVGLYFISADPGQPGNYAAGRTAARWFDGRWYDVYATKMLTNRLKGYAFTDSSALDYDLIHLALFPVINFNVTSGSVLAGNLDCAGDPPVTGLAEQYVASGGLKLHPGYPNPTAGRVCLPVSLQQSGRVTLTVFDTGGRQIDQRQYAFLTPGLQQLCLAAERYGRGIYTCVIRTAGAALATQFVVAP